MNQDAFRSLLEEAVEHWPEFDDQGEVDEIDLLDWFVDWRRRAMRALAEGSAQ